MSPRPVATNLPCPVCAARQGFLCRTPTAKPHPERVAAVRARDADLREADRYQERAAELEAGAAPTDDERAAFAVVLRGDAATVGTARTLRLCAWLTPSAIRRILDRHPQH